MKTAVQMVFIYHQIVLKNFSAKKQTSAPHLQNRKPQLRLYPLFCASYNFTQCIYFVAIHYGWQIFDNISANVGIH